MKKQTVFITLSGNIGNYVTKISREEKTKNADIQALQIRLNTLIKQESGLPATAENLNRIWNNLTDMVKDIETVLTNKKDPAFLEIVNKVNMIGYSIAYICKRRNGGWVDNEVRFKYTMTDEEILHTFKLILLNYYNNGVFKKEKDGKWYVNGALLLKDYTTMTDEELLPIAKECAIDQFQRDQKAKEEEINNTIEHFGIEIQEHEYNTIEESAANATLQECYIIMETAVKQVSYCRDRLMTLDSGNQAEIDKLHDWDEREPNNHYVSDNVKDIKKAAAEFAIAHILYLRRARQIIEGEVLHNNSVGFTAKLAFDE